MAILGASLGNSFTGQVHRELPVGAELVDFVFFSGDGARGQGGVETQTADEFADVVRFASRNSSAAESLEYEEDPRG